MVLSDQDIKKLIEERKITIKPAPDFSIQLGPCSLDLRLSDIFRVFDYGKHAYLDPFRKNGDSVTRRVKIKRGEAFIIHPGDFILAATEEYITLPSDLIGRLEGRSSIGRLGIVIHSTAGRIDPGWRGNVTLEIANMGKIPVALYPNMRICSVSFETLSSPAANPYHLRSTSKYINQKEPEESRIIGEKK